MKKIITSSLLLGFGLLSGLATAQQFSSNQHIAIQSDKVEQFKTVFQKADYNKCFNVKNNAYTPFAYSAWNNKKNITKFLLDNGANVNQACNGVTPLMSVAMFGNADMVKLLLSKGANKNATDNNNKTAKDYALQYGFTAVAQLLK